MSNIKVRIGKREVTLEKSQKLVGLKRKKTSSLLAKSFKGNSYVKSNIYDALGGFNVVSLYSDGPSLDWKLNEIREYDSVDVGTHVYLSLIHI